MNVLFWILQVALALLSLAGGAYKVFSFDALATSRSSARSRATDGAPSACSRCCARFCWSSRPP